MKLFGGPKDGMEIDVAPGVRMVTIPRRGSHPTVMDTSPLSRKPEPDLAVDPDGAYHRVHGDTGDRFEWHPHNWVSPDVGRIRDQVRPEAVE